MDHILIKTKGKLHPLPSHMMHTPGRRPSIDTFRQKLVEDLNRLPEDPNAIPEWWDKMNLFGIDLGDNYAAVRPELRIVDDAVTGTPSKRGNRSRGKISLRFRGLFHCTLHDVRRIAVTINYDAYYALVRASLSYMGFLRANKISFRDDFMRRSDLEQAADASENLVLLARITFAWGDVDKATRLATAAGIVMQQWHEQNRDFDAKTHYEQIATMSEGQDIPPAD